MRILLTGSVPPALQRALRKTGFEIDSAPRDPQAHHDIYAGAYDVILLDVDPPRTNGMALVKRWRSDGVHAHIVVVTSNRTVQHRVEVLSAGVDECVLKPYDHGELLVRLRTLLPAAPLNEESLTVFDLEINVGTRTVRRAGTAIALTAREFEVLHCLALNLGKPVSRAMLREHLYHDAKANTSNVVDVYIRYLREKIDKSFEPALILTCRGKGYMLRGVDGVGAV